MNDYPTESLTQRLRREFRERNLQSITKESSVVTFENNEVHPTDTRLKMVDEVSSVVPLSPEVVKIEADKSNTPEVGTGTSSLAIEAVDLVPVVPSEPKRKGVSLRVGLFLKDYEEELSRSNKARRAAKGPELTHCPYNKKA